MTRPGVPAGKTAVTLRAGLAALLADAGITDVDAGAAVADGHVRSCAYQRIIAVTAASRSRGGDRAVAAVILRDPDEMAARTAVVALVDKVAVKSAGPAGFRQHQEDTEHSREPSHALRDSPGSVSAQ